MIDALISDDLDAFAAFAARLNFTRAAEDLHVSQPALHTRIRKLEGRVGARLYRRAGRRLELTVAGERLAAFAHDALDRAEAFAASVTAEPPRPLALAAGSGAYLYLLGDAIQGYLAGGTRLRLMTTDAEATLAAVRAGSADVGVTALDVPPDDLDVRPLARFPQVFVMPAEHRYARRRSLRLADLAGEPLILPPTGRPHRRVIEARGHDEGITWSVAVEAEGWELMLQFVRLGVGGAIVNGSVVVAPPLVTAPVSDLPVVRYYLLTRPDRADDPRVRRFREAL